MSKGEKLIIRINNIINRFKLDSSNFSVKLAFVNMAIGITFEGRIGKCFYENLYRKKHEIIIDYLDNKLQDIFSKNEVKENYERYNEENIIWISWLQGVEAAPKIVKKCIASVKKNAGQHRVVIIDESNYSEYTNIPDYIIEKYKKGVISKTHFSDILRVNLLMLHGGLWIDATVFCTSKISDELFRLPIYSCKKPGKSIEYISNYMWTSFILGGNDVFFYNLLNELLCSYWKNEDTMIDYLLIDYLIYLTAMNYKYVKDSIDNIPYNNTKMDDLVTIFNQEYDEEQFSKLMNSRDNIFFKLSWKEQYIDYTKDGKLTNYYYFMKEDL